MVFRYYLKLLSIPLSLLALFVSIFILWKILGLPSADELIKSISAWMDKYGLLVIFAGAFVEGILLIGAYFPGLFVIFVSIVSSSSVEEAATRVFLGTLGLILAHATNYVLGRYGWYKLLAKLGTKKSIEEAQEKLSQNDTKAIWASYWLPSLATVVDTASGILKIPFKKFILSSISASVFWNLITGIVVYAMGSKALVLVTSGGMQDLLIQISIVLLWCLILIFSDLRKRKTTPI